MSVDSDFDHFEIVFAHAAIGAFPIVGHILPFCAGRDVVFGPAFGFIVNVAAYNTFPAFHLILLNIDSLRVRNDQLSSSIIPVHVGSGREFVGLGCLNTNSLFLDVCPVAPVNPSQSSPDLQ